MKKNKLCSAIAPLLLTVSLSVSAQMTTEAGVGGQSNGFSGIAGGGVVLFDQTSGSSVNGAPDQNFEAAYDAYDAFAADDFVVGGSGWTITQIDTIGTTTGPANSVSIGFHADMGGTPNPVAVAGCEYTDIAITSEVAGAFTVVLPTACSLPAGIHWLVIQTNQDFAVSGQHFWSNTTDAIAGAEGHWLNPGDGFATGCTDWSPGGSVCGIAGGVAYDHLFSITGIENNDFSVGGNVTGLTDFGLVLQNNGGDDLPIVANGAFSFATGLPDSTNYAVTILNQPNNQECVVTNDIGTVSGSDIVDVAVTCVDLPPRVIPTLSQWSLFLMALLLSLMAYRKKDIS